MDEFVGIRFGYLPHDADPETEPEWIFFDHSEYDGIGAFAHLLREGGVDMPWLPRGTHSATPNFYLNTIRTLVSFLKPRKTVNWRKMGFATGDSDSMNPPTALAYHSFSASDTQKIRMASRRARVSVNSYLLRHLDRAVRLDFEDPSVESSWMIPVNLRGKVNCESDEGNHSSYIFVKVLASDNFFDVHSKTYRKLKSGYHWVAWNSYKMGRFLSSKMKSRVIKSDKALLDISHGGFSNLGQWDLEEKIQLKGLKGIWFFCPPVLRGQKIGAGCITFQNRLSLTLQLHPELATDPECARRWIRNWIREIEVDLFSE